MKDTLSLAPRDTATRVGSMLRVDGHRMLRTRSFYIVLLCALLVPILMNVMMTMMDGTVSVNPQTGVETVIHGPESVWQSIGTLPGGEAMGGMDVMAMCNINMAFMGVCAFICLFISEDFKSGYAKNLFSVRAHRGEYVLSKTVMGFLCGTLMLFAYFIGALVGGAVSGLSFAMEGFTVANLVFCLLSKCAFMLVFVSIFTLISVAARAKTWLSVLGSLGGGMLLFTMTGMVTPLTATPMHLLITLAGGILFALGLGLASRTVLRRTAMV